MTPTERTVAVAWDSEYSSGRYVDELPVAFVKDILDCAKAEKDTDQPGLYIGCGNGRNYVPLVEGGLDLVGIDISQVAIDQLAARMPERRDRLVCGDISAIHPKGRHPLVVAIQVFQHGDQATAHDHVRSAQGLVAHGGLMAVRVNAVGTDIAFQHRIIDGDKGTGFTVEYLEGPKQGLAVHFFSGAELDALFEADFEPVLPRRAQGTRRADGSSWTQWESIWRRRPESPLTHDPGPSALANDQGP